MPAKKKSSLMTPDPYHTPGYCGYVPQFKYDIAQTFGIHTHKLLTSADPKVASSGNSVLCDIFPTQASLAAATNVDFTDSPVYRNTRRSWGDQKYVPHMVPGYTGYIPKGWQYFGSRYAELCHNAMSSFEGDQHNHRSKMEELRSLTHPDSLSQGDTATSTPLRPIRAKAKPYYLSPRVQESPHYAPGSTPSKYQISGYMGFVPKAQRYFGLGYPIITSHALQDHDNEAERLTQSYSEPVRIQRPPEKPMATVEIYPKSSGLIPRYTGHIPGQKFRFGDTFGCSTRDACHVMSMSA